MPGTSEADKSFTFTTHERGLQVAYDQRGWGTDWPTEACVPGFRKQTLTFMHKCHDLCLFILECFAEGLGLPLDSFSKVCHLQAACRHLAWECLLLAAILLACDF